MESRAPLQKRGQIRSDRRLREVEAVLGQGLVALARANPWLAPLAGALRTGAPVRAPVRSAAPSPTTPSAASAPKAVAPSTPPNKAAIVPGSGRGQPRSAVDKVLVPVGELALDLANRRDPLAKFVAGYLTREQLRPLGAARGVLNVAKDAVEMAPALELASAPIPTLLGPQRDRVLKPLVSQAMEVALPTAKYIASRSAEPNRIGDDLKAGFHNWRVSIDPTATPQADTVGGEVLRNAPIALNQGELAVDLWLLSRGGSVRRALTRWGRGPGPGPGVPIPPDTPKPIVEYLSTPYEQKGRRRVGHHSGVKQRHRLPGGGRIPKAIMDNRLNVVKFEELTTGQAYRRHRGLDFYYRGGLVPKEFGGGGWSAKKFGWGEFGPAERLWYGTPEALKDLVGAGVVSPIILNNGEDADEAQDE